MCCGCPGVLLEDTTNESGLTNTWENVWDIISRYTKRGQWLSDEEKRTTELTLRPRFVAEDHRPLAWETTTEEGIDVTVLEQLLKEMENLKISMVKKSEDHPTNSKYMDHRCIWCDSSEHDRKDWNSEGKGKGKMIPAFKLASDIEQRMDLKKVFKERILDCQVEFSH